MRLRAIISKTKIGKRAMEDEKYRVLLKSCLSLALNLAYAIYNGILGVRSGSAWFITMFAYYAVLALMRFFAIRSGLRDSSEGRGRQIMAFAGFSLIFLGIVLSGSVVLSITYALPMPKDFNVMIANAAWTFYKAVKAIIDIVKARKSRSYLVLTLRNISLAAAAGAMLSLTRTMLATFGSTDGGFYVTMNGAVGMGAFLIVTALGVGMLAASRRKDREVEK